MLRTFSWWFGFAILTAGGCATLFGEEDPRPLPWSAAVRVQSGNVMGSGCMVLSRSHYGSYVLTAAHLIQQPRKTLVATSSAVVGGSWRSARVLRVNRNLDLALLWLPEPIPGVPERVAWTGGAPDVGTRVTLLAVAPARGPETYQARVTRPGYLRVDRALWPGMSGSGVFEAGRLAGLLFGQTTNAAGRSPHEGRFVSVDVIRCFLDVGFEFLASGGLPAEPR